MDKIIFILIMLLCATAFSEGSSDTPADTTPISMPEGSAGNYERQKQFPLEKESYEALYKQACKMDLQVYLKCPAKHVENFLQRYTKKWNLEDEQDGTYKSPEVSQQNVVFEHQYKPEPKPDSDTPRNTDDETPASGDAPKETKAVETDQTQPPAAAPEAKPEEKPATQPEAQPAAVTTGSTSSGTTSNGFTTNIWSDGNTSQPAAPLTLESIITSDNIWNANNVQGTTVPTSSGGGTLMNGMVTTN